MKKLVGILGTIALALSLGAPVFAAPPAAPAPQTSPVRHHRRHARHRHHRARAHATVR